MNEGQKIRLCRSLYGWLQALVGVLVVLVLCFTFFGRVMAVDGHSMEPTLEDRSLMLVRRAGYTPAAGDVVVLRKAFGLTDGPIVKRIVATGGQRVEIDYRAGTVTVDGQVLCEPYIKEAMAQPWYENLTAMTVPEGCVFVLGDNRNGSNDSRDVTLGAVDVRYILGKAELVFFPPGAAGLIQ